MCQEPTPRQAAKQPPVISDAPPLAKETAQPRGEGRSSREQVPVAWSAPSHTSNFNPVLL